MKKILAAVMMLAGAAAYAQVDASEVGPKVRQGASDVGQEAKKAEKSTEAKAKEVGKSAGAATEDQGTFKEAQAFSIKGDVKEGGRGEITLARKGLPDAVLDIRGQTKVYVDGKRAEAKDIKEGMKVNAKFQLEGEESVAVHVDAKSVKGMGGAGQAGMNDNDKDDSVKQNAEDAWTEGRKAPGQAKENTEQKSDELKNDMEK